MVYALMRREQTQPLPSGASIPAESRTGAQLSWPFAVTHLPAPFALTERGLGGTDSACCLTRSDHSAQDASGFTASSWPGGGPVSSTSNQEAPLFPVYGRCVSSLHMCLLGSLFLPLHLPETCPVGPHFQSLEPDILGSFWILFHPPPLSFRL